MPSRKAMLEKLPPYRINPDGSLAEWADPFYEDENEHRHQSHLYGVFPGHEIREGSPLFGAYRLAEDKRWDEGLSSMSSCVADTLTDLFHQLVQVPAAGVGIAKGTLDKDLGLGKILRLPACPDPQRVQLRCQCSHFLTD